MPFDKAVADQVLAKCGRHCCLCRRFRPTWLQVHHIKEESKGGESTEANAIALCVTCHIDVHTKRPFTQRFSFEELVQHRDQVFRLVDEGKLCRADDSISEFVIDESSLQSTTEELKLSALAVKILVSAAEVESQIMLHASVGRRDLSAGKYSESVGMGRRLSETEDAIEQLVYDDLLKDVGYEGTRWQLTHKGYQVADIAMAMAIASE